MPAVIQRSAASIVSTPRAPRNSKRPSLVKALEESLARAARAGDADGSAEAGGAVEPRRANLGEAGAARASGSRASLEPRDQAREQVVRRDTAAPGASAERSAAG